MNERETISVIILSVFTITIAARLFSTRIPVSQFLKMAIGWIALFGLAFVIFSYRTQFSRIGKTVRAEFSPDSLVGQDGSLSIRISDDGHFWVNALINGKAQRLMVDSGASITALSLSLARESGVAIDENAMPILIETANGTISATRGKVSDLRIGPIQRQDFSIIVSDRFGDVSVLGMNFLSTLKGWSVRDEMLVLNP
jgi:aspartyl protease family protein